MDWSAVGTLCGQLGPVLGLVALLIVFFLWKDWRREMRLQDRVETLEREQKEVMLPMIERCASVIAQNTAVMSRLEKVIDRMLLTEQQDDRAVIDRMLTEAALNREQ